METERTKPNKLLKGKENYLPWLNYLEGIADVDDLFELKEPTDELTIAANSTNIFPWSGEKYDLELSSLLKPVKHLAE